MSDLNQGASEAELLQALRWALEWIDAVPSDTPLPTMPGFDRDYVNELIDRARRTPAATTGDGELPPLPKKTWEQAPYLPNYYESAAWARGWNDAVAALAAPASAQPAVEREWNQLMDVLGCEDTESALKKIAELIAQPDQRESAAEGEAVAEIGEGFNGPFQYVKFYKVWRLPVGTKLYLAAAASPAAQPVAKDEPELDPLYEKAVMIVRARNRVATATIQRELLIGYNRASRLIEAMEAAGVVSPPNENGYRTVLTVEQGQDSANNGAEGEKA